MSDMIVSREQLATLKAQIDTVLGRIETTLETEALVADLPIVGTSLAGAYQQGQLELRAFERLIAGLSSVLQSLATDPVAPMSETVGNPGDPRAPLAFTPGPLASFVASKLNTEIQTRGFAGVANVTSDSAGVLYLNLNTSYHPAAYVQNLSTTLGTGKLGLTTQGSATLTLGYDLNVTFAVDALGTSSGASGPGFKATIDTSNISFTGSAVLGPARFQASDLGSGIHGAFTILTDGSPATFTGTADLDIHLQGDLGSAALPSISTDLDIAWALNTAATGPTSTGPFGTIPTVSFKNVTWDLGQFFDKVMKPALDAIRPLVQPIRTILNVLSTDLVGIKSVLGYGWRILDTVGSTDSGGQAAPDGKLTLLDLYHLARPNLDLSNVTKAIAVINAITTVVEALELLNDTTAYYNLGSFTFNADIRQAAFVLAQAVPTVTQPAQNLATALTALSNGQTTAANIATVATTLTQLTTVGNSIQASGLTQGSTFAALLGVPTDLFTVNVPSFTLGFGSVDANGAPTSTVPLAVINVFPFIDVSVDAALQATVALNFGYDTSGAIAYANGNFSDPSQALNGLWISNPDDVLSTALLRIAGSVGLNVNAGVRNLALLSGGGDIGGEVEFFLPQAGRNYLSDLQRYVQSGTFFATRGELTAGFNASVTVGVPFTNLTSRIWDAHTNRFVLASYNQLLAPLPASAPTATNLAVYRLNDVPGQIAGILLVNHNAKIRIDFDLPVDVRGIPTLTLDDGGTAVFDGAATMALGNANSLIFTYVVQPSDSSTPGLTVTGLGAGGTIVEAGVPDGLPARTADTSIIRSVVRNGVTIGVNVLNNVRVDTAVTRTFVDAVGDGADASHWDVAFVNVSGTSTSGPGGQQLSLNYYGNAVIAAGNTATFSAGTAKAESVDVRAGATLLIAGGTVDTTGSYKQNSTVLGTLRVQGGATWMLDDNLANAGLVNLVGGSGQQATWALGKNVTLTGGGTVRLSNDAANRIIAQAPVPGATPVANSLNNFDNRIEGSGTVGSNDPADDVVVITNFAAGTVVATGTTELRILNDISNAGALGAVGAGVGTPATTGGLRLIGDLFNYASGSDIDGTLSALQGGRVILDNMTVTRGGITTADTGLITTAGAVTIDAATPMSLRARIVAGAGSTLTMTGNFTQAAFEETPANGARLSAGTGTLMLDGISLTDGLVASDAGGTVHVVNAVTLTGTAQPVGAPGLVTNATLITDAGSSLRLAGAIANRGSIGGAAAITASGTLRNTGSIGGASFATNGSLTNTNAISVVGDLSASVLFDNTGTATAGGNLRAGRLTNTNTISVTGNLSASAASENTGMATVGGSFNADGGLTNQGSIVAASVRIAGGSNTATIGTSGSVAIGNTFGNIGTITAGSDVFLQGTIDNHGTISGTSFILSGAIDNTAGLLRVANGGVFAITDGTTIKGGTLRAVGGAQGDAPAIRASGAVTLDGTGERVNNFGVLTASLISNQNGPITGRTLRLTGVINQYSSPTLAGTIVADNETIVLDNATLQNGTLRQVGTGRFSLVGASVLDGTNFGLTLPGALTIDAGQAPTIRGLIVNAGAVALDGYRDTGSATLRVSGTARLSGGGSVTLRDVFPGFFGGTAKITGTSTADVLENADNAISGYGELGAGTLTFVNDAGGTITATGSTLRLYAGAASVNRGLMQATTGTLVIENAIANAGGRIAAAGGRVQLGGDGRAATIAGGTLQTSGAGVMAVNAAGATLDGTQTAVTNTGALTVEQNARLTLTGAIANTGGITLDGYRDTGVARLRVSGAATLSGGGTLTLRDSFPGFVGNTARVDGATTADTLTNVDNLITGYGELGDGSLTFVNAAAGTVTATTGTLRFYTGAAPVNRGLMQATSGTLLIESAVDNAGGRIMAAGGTVQLGGDGRVGRVAGGTIGSTGTSRVTVQQAVLDGTASTVTSTASILVDQNQRLTLTGAVANAGAIAIDGYRDTGIATLGVSGTATLSGGGTIAMRDSFPGFFGNTAVISGASTADVLDNVNNTISGYGQLGAGKLRFINEAAGVVRAVTSNLTIDTGAAAIVNRGLLESAGGTLVLNSAVSNTGRILAGSGTLTLRTAIDNTGSILAGDGGTLVLDGGIVSGSGRLGSTGLGTVRVATTGTIDGGTLATELVGTLSVAAGAVLTLKAGIANSGTMTVDGYRDTGPATLRIAGTVRLQGGGGVVLRDVFPGFFGGTAKIAGTTMADVLENVDNAISGYGDLGAGALTFINAAAGTVTATASTLRLFAGAGSINRGLLQATTGTLLIENALANAGGRIAAAGGRVQLGGEGRAATIVGGTLQTSGAGIMAVNAAGATLDGTATAVNNTGTVTVENGAQLTLAGAIANTGTLLLDAYRDTGIARLRVAGAVTLSGGGTLTLRDGFPGFFGGTARVRGTTTADTLTNLDNTITGYGALGEGTLGFINEAQGVVTAAGSTLQLYTGATLVNRGLMQATTGTLLIEGVIANAGRIAAAGGRVQLGGEGRAATIVGGMLQTSGAGVMAVNAAGATLDGTQGAVTLAGAMTVETGARLTLSGAIANTGGITLEGYRDTGVARLRVSGAATLSGGGTLTLRDSFPGFVGNTARVDGATTADTLTNVDNLITGYGELGDGSLTFVNAAAGTVTATTGTLRFYTGAAPVNRGLMQATSGTLLIESAVDNAGGRIMAAGGTVQLGGDGRVGRVAGGTIGTTGNSRVTVQQAVLDGTASAVSSTASILVDQGQRLTLMGAVVNAGAIAIDGYRDTGIATLGVSGTATLSGGGTIAMRDSFPGFLGATAVISGASTADVLNNQNNTISGYGQLGMGKMRFVNEAAGVVRASVSTLTINTGTEAIVNRGLLESAGGTLTLSSAVTNAGTIEARNGTVTLSQRVTGGTLKVDAGQRMNVNGGMTGSLIDLQGANATMAIANGGQPISATVKGLDATDRLEFAGLSATGTYAGGVLTLKSGGATVGSLVMAGATETDNFVAQSNGAGGTRIVQQTIAPTSNDVRFTNVVTNTSGRDVSEVYSGPVDYLQRQYIWSSPDIVAMSATMPNTFIKGGNGGDAILVTGGQNVIDGGGGSNFLIGADGSDGGKDVFFVDSREDLETWSTIVNFHKGDLATIFGFREGISTRPYTDVDGAAGFTGVTIHSEINGMGTGIKGSMTFAGIDRATADAHFEITTGTLPGDIGYMLIEYK